MTVVAVDDEEISLMCLEGVLEQMEDVETIHSFNNAEDAIAFFQKNRADAAFLDIQLYPWLPESRNSALPAMWYL